MPQKFSDHEKIIIRDQLREKGKTLFERQGLRKTTVEELTQEAGISKGAFYQFYDSKEELYLDILEQLEKEIQTSILEFAMSPDENTHDNVANLLRNFLFSMDDSPILKNFGREDFDYLVRKIPAERVLQHANSDKEFMKEFLNKINREGITVTASVSVISDLIKSLFYVGLHREDFGKDAYRELMDVLIHLIAGYIAGKNNELRD